ncbi:MAG TPA: signal peptidase I [Thermoanaerobaculia bacterium]|nr:signal peptidase I [Thermoanaerobaculia bacterium]
MVAGPRQRFSFGPAADLLEALVLAILCATFARTFLVQAFKIPSSSMEPNLLIGDHLLVNKFIYGPGPAWLGGILPARPVERGDVVVFKFPDDPGRDFIKRCVGLPGDEVELVDKQLSINGQVVDESAYVRWVDDVTFPQGFASGPHGIRDNFGPYTVPVASYFCLGDNRDDSNDSRFWGAVPAEHLRGRAFMIYWSVEPLAEAEEPTGPIAELGRRLRRGAHFLLGLRRERSLRIVR